MRGDAAYKAANYAEAARHYMPAAKCGNAIAQSRLGYMLLNGQGVPADPKAAADWLGKAAEQGDTAAQVNLASLLREGRGVPKDEATAYKWFMAAAEQGVAEGQFSVGVMLQMGLGIKADQVEAAKWYYKAAVQGQSLAQSSLALIEIGIFGQNSQQRAALVRAYAWARIAGTIECASAPKPSSEIVTAEASRRQTCEIGQTVRKLASSALLPNELVDAGRLADGWKPGSTSIAAPPSQLVALVTPADENLKRQESLRENAQTKPTRTRELAALDRWISGQISYAGVRTFVAVLPVPNLKKDNGFLRLVCPERWPQGPYLVLSNHLFETPPRLNTPVQDFNGKPVLGGATPDDVIIPIDVGLALSGPPADIDLGNRTKLTGEALNAGNGTFRFRMNGKDEPEIVVKQRLSHTDPAQKSVIAFFGQKDFKPTDLRTALTACQGLAR